MSQASFRFYAELNDFLPSERRQVCFAHAFENRASVKDMIEALGAPHTEIELILANGQPVDFSYIVQDGDHISVYPVFESIDPTPVVRLRPAPLRDPRFVLDAHLGKLAGYLRLLGFDTLYRNDYDDAQLARISSDERRILLTRDRGLLKRSTVTHGYYVREADPQRQIIEVLRRFDMHRLIAPFMRCIRCNGVLHRADKEAIGDRLPPHTRDYYDEFHVCDQCGKVYWKGAHYQHLVDFITRIANAPDALIDRS
ncbi:MAG: Mut7-C ubiquitin/RNAse domain-containing protein [Chloroflexi bacterium]|nr:Mut7-C ubiquitin/RNAse domain-containing protein [Chloroflexota bacterium]MCL5274307.1 Mut7-C ubiquitin/RNAse domain-containing protein [Chloroflexota bacterium]